MARTIRTKVYLFSELSKTAQSKAVELMGSINVDNEWWECTYEDAANVGLKITGFDIDRRNYCKGDFILSANEVAANIFRDHGEHCETYKTAESFMEEWQPVFNEYLQTEEGEQKLMDIEEDFKTNILEDYRIMLKEQYEYETGDEAIIATIESNEYEFKQDGTRF